MPLNEKCPQCGKTLFRKKGKTLILCHDKACGYEREAKASELTLSMHEKNENENDHENDHENNKD